MTQPESSRDQLLAMLPDVSDRLKRHLTEDWCPDVLHCPDNDACDALYDQLEADLVST